MMDTSKALKNASWIIFVKIFQAIIAFVISIITARYLGPSNFGLINYASSIVTFVLPIMQLGLNSIIVKELIEKPKEEGKIIGTSLVLNSISSIFTIIGIFTFVSFMNKGETETIIVTMLYSLTLLAQIFEIIIYWFQAKLRSKYIVIVQLIVYILIACYKIYLLMNGKSIRWFAISNALDYFIINIILIIMYFKLDGQKFLFSANCAKKMLKESKYYILSGLMISIFSQTDKIMLKLMVNEEATGFYSAAVACAGLTTFIFSAIIDSARPIIFENKKNDDIAFNKNIKLLYTIIIYLSLLQSVAFCIFSNLIINIMYGKEFIQSASVLRVLVWYEIFCYMGSVRNVWLLAEKKQNKIFVIDLSGAIVNILLNFFLIPKFGIMGATVASLVTQIFTNFILGFIIKEVRPNNKLILESLKFENIRIILNKIKKIIPIKEK